MQRITMLFGLALIATGVGFYFGSNQGSVTALIPSFIGIIFVACALIARRGEGARKHAMHVVAGLSLLSAAMTVKGLFALIGGDTSMPAMGRSITFVLCVLLLVLCVNSFIQARKARNAS